MARGYPDIIHPYPMFQETQEDVERMSRENMRRYLHHRLRSLDVRIRALSREHGGLTGQQNHQAWNGGVTRNIWEDVLEMDYLQAMRDAIADTLAAL